MRRSQTSFRIPALLAAVALSCLPVALHADVTTDSGEQYTLVLGITEDPDPITAVGWDQVDSEIDGEVLNAEGEDRGDGPPAVDFVPSTRYPVVVWSYNQGVDFDLAISAWDGEVWTPIDFLAQSLSDELDPRLHLADDGSARVTWWQPGYPDRIGLVERPADSEAWSAPQLLSIEGRRPSVLATDEGAVILAFERDLPGGGQQIVVQVRPETGPPIEQVLLSTPRSQPLDIELHEANGQVWVDWKHIAGMFAYSEFVDGVWTPALGIPWTDPSWLGAETVRKEIQLEVVEP